MESIKQILINLASETELTKKENFFKNYLNTISKFHNYSYYNQLLISSQYPNATKIAGIKTWNKLGRKVIKKSKAIRILAPIKIEEDNERAAYFKKVSVFDISQTEGKELPEIDISTKGDDNKLLQDLIPICSKKAITVEFKALREDLYGTSKDNLIIIDNTESINTQINTLLHELTHCLLHKSSKLSKQQKEIQAESVAYVVAKHFNLEPKSFNYLALYDADYEKIMDNLKIIAETSRIIIKELKNENNIKSPNTLGQP